MRSISRDPEISLRFGNDIDVRFLLEEMYMFPVTLVNDPQNNEVADEAVSELNALH